MVVAPLLCFMCLFRLVYLSWTHSLWPTHSGSSASWLCDHHPMLSSPGLQMGVTIEYTSMFCSEDRALNALSTHWHTGRAFYFSWRKHLEVSGMVRVSQDQAEGWFALSLTDA